MVLVILFSGKTAPKVRPLETPVASVIDPNLAGIEEVRRRIENAANKLKKEQDRVAAVQAGMTAQAMPAPTEQPYSRSAAQAGYGNRGSSYSDLNSPRSWSDAEDEKRE